MTMSCGFKLSKLKFVLLHILTIPDLLCAEKMVEFK